MRKLFVLLTAGMLTSMSAIAENDPGHLTCLTHEHDAEVAARYGVDLNNNAALRSYEAFAQEYTRAHYNTSGNRTALYTIPVVFHIVHAGGPENISDAQVYDALYILNRDYSRMNADTANVVAQFKSIVADCQIEFRLAQKDALGNCVKGITRTYSTETYVGTDAMVDDVNRNLNGNSNANNIRFPRDKYLNVWICSDPNGAAGYTNTPFIAAFDANHDGIWIKHNYFGSIGTSSVLTSRALTHEVGHWFNLSHVWGNTNNPGVSCGDDNVTDTPQTKGWQSCNLSGATCGNPIDNVQNYMEYSYCSNMFTEGQKSRMHAALNSPIASRNNLWKPANLTLTGTDGNNNLCAADFEGDNLVICQGDSVAFTDLSYHGATGWNWTFNGGTPGTSTAQNPVITFNTPGSYDVSLSTTDGVGNVSTTKTAYVTVLPSSGTPYPYAEGFESLTTLNGSSYFVDNPDGQQAWEIYTGTGSSGNKCVKLDNFNNLSDNTKDAFSSSTIDMSGLPSVTFTFWMAYTSKTGSQNDILRVYISNNCGKNWVLKKSFTGAQMTSSTPSTSAFTPSVITQWGLHEVTNIASIYLTSDFRFKFEWQSDLGNNVYIDDININGPAATDELNSGYAFSLMPNPAETQAQINLVTPNPEKVTIQVTDLSGRLVWENKSVQATAGSNVIAIPLTELSKGMYVVNLVAGDVHFSQKLVKE